MFRITFGVFFLGCNLVSFFTSHKMIRICGANLKNIVGNAKIFHSSSFAASSSVICMSKRLQTTEVLENPKKIADNETQMLKRERQVEVHILARKNSIVQDLLVEL